MSIPVAVLISRNCWGHSEPNKSWEKKIHLWDLTKKTYAYDKNPESLCYEQKHMSVLISTETIIEYWFNYSSSSKFSSAAQTLTLVEELVQFASLFNALLDKQKANLDHSDGKCRDCECICVLSKTSYTLLFQILKFPSHKFVPHGFQLYYRAVFFCVA